MELYIVGRCKALVIQIEEDLDHHTAGKIRDVINRELPKTGAINLIFDFSRVNFMDSSGIGMIIGRYKTAKTLGGRIVIAGASEGVKRIIKMSGVDELVLMTDTVDKALEEVTADAAE
ncbi:MAG: anti-sigma factor antagonist [Clostridia bacterium]|nr:anti-sigma factor antagonist [Clostridia bacterium]